MINKSFLKIKINRNNDKFFILFSNLENHYATSIKNVIMLTSKY